MKQNWRKKEQTAFIKPITGSRSCLYIEAVYNIRLRNDSVAKNILQTLIGQNPSTPTCKKSPKPGSGFKQAKQIEDELTQIAGGTY